MLVGVLVDDVLVGVDELPSTPPPPGSPTPSFVGNAGASGVDVVSVVRVEVVGAGVVLSPAQISRNARTASLAAL